MQRANSKLMCRACDLVVLIPPYRRGYRCVCPQCRSQLRSGHRESMRDLGIVAISSIVILMITLTLPFMTISAMGITQPMALTSIFAILRQDWLSLVYICMIFTFLCPLIVHVIIVAIAFGKLRVTRTIANIYMVCHRFSMVDVFILGILVSLVKLIALAQVTFHSGFYFSIIFALQTVWVCSRGSPFIIWNLLYRHDIELKPANVGIRGIDQGLMMCRHCGMTIKLKRARNKNLKDISATCPRCGHHVSFRANHSYQKTIALLLCAIILYVPSNIYPIMYTEYLGAKLGSNIIDGVLELWGMKSYFVSIVVFTASICIPVIKIFCILLLIWLSLRGFAGNPTRYNLLYRVILFIGRWSMIDVFVVIIMSTVVRMSGLLTISPGIAILFFSSVVLITMLAAEEYDERLLWDKYLARQHGLSKEDALMRSYQMLTKQGAKAAPSESQASLAKVVTNESQADAKEASAFEQPSAGEYLAKAQADGLSKQPDEHGKQSSASKAKQYVAKIDGSKAGVAIELQEKVQRSPTGAQSFTAKINQSKQS